MTRWLLVARYFRVVPPVRPPIVALFAALAGLSVALSLAQPARSSLPLGALLLLQAFAASSGVHGAARAGYFDGLMVRGLRREEILLGHWAASTTPGLLCWAVVSIVGLVTGLADGRRAVASGSWAALWLVSSIPWAATVALPRFTGAIVWVVCVATLAEVFVDRPGSLVRLEAGEVHGLATSLWPIVYPWGLVGRDLVWADLRSLSPMFLLSALGMAGVLVWFKHVDFAAETEP